jgi:hypothetical protein
MQRSLRLAALLLTLTGFSQSTGCAVEPANEPVAVADGLTITEANESLGKVVAVYRADGRAITFELRLGPKMQTPPSKEDQESPSYEIDARVTDQKGDLMYIQAGGDSFLDPTWRVPPVAHTDLAGRRADFALMTRSAAAWRELKLPASLAQLRLSGIEIANGIANSLVDDAATPAPSATVPAGAEGGTLGVKNAAAIDTSATGMLRWNFRVWWKEALGNQWTKHSTVELRSKESDGTVENITRNYKNCNHGSCVGNSNLSLACTSVWLLDNGRRERKCNNEPAESLNSPSGGSNTEKAPPRWGL